MKVLSADQMANIDRLTVERCNISFAELMENAGSRVVEAVTQYYGSVKDKRTVVFCGKGNNGGDGAVIARQLCKLGASVDIYLFGRIADTSGEACANFESVKTSAETAGHLSFYENAIAEKIETGYDLIIDALFGTGLTRPVEGKYAEAIKRIRHIKDIANAFVVSVDIPSGLSSDSGVPPGIHVDADMTVSFTAPKVGNIMHPAGMANGRLIIASIGTPDSLIDNESGSTIELVTKERVAEWLRLSRRSIDAHKGSAGDLLLIAGSLGKTGAAALASAAALRSGAGLVTVATARSAQSLLVSQALPEVMTEWLEEGENDAVCDAAIEKAIHLSEKRTVVALGPGLSSSDESTRRFVSKYLNRRRTPLVIDADGLNSLAPWPDGLHGSDELPIIITPHPGEMARLIGQSIMEVKNDVISIARDFSSRFHILTVLKGSRTIIAKPNGSIFINTTGNPGMATAGSGDILTGLVAGLTAQKPDDISSAVISAVYLHGLAGDLAASVMGHRALVASDIIDHFAEAFIQTGGEKERGKQNNVIRI